MAWSDYKICDCCGNAKVFYDANIQDARYQATWGEPSDYDPIGLKAICGECNKTHEVVIALREKETADRIEELVKERDYIEGTNDTLIALNQALEAKLTKSLDEREQALKSCEQTLDERDEALAKLAKAVEMLREIEADCDADYPPSHGAIKYAIRAVLAELEGKP